MFPPASWYWTMPAAPMSRSVALRVTARVRLVELDSGMKNVYGAPMNCGALSFPSRMVILIVVVAMRAGVPGEGITKQPRK